MILYLIRHGKTEGNRFKRYIGRTDEPLCEEGIEELKKHPVPFIEHRFVSPLKRCVETDRLLFGEKGIVELVPGFKECDFGLFEGKNYLELENCPEYQTWIDSNGEGAFPGGEDPAAFKERCCNTFEAIIKVLTGKGIDEAAFVIHGGTIMSLMERYARPEKVFYEWYVKNGEGYKVSLEDKSFELRVVE